MRNRYKTITIDDQDFNVFTLNGERWNCPRGMPLTVRVLGQVFQVHYHTNLYMRPEAKSRLRGVVLYSERVIILDPDQPIHCMKQTLFHEMAHVYLKDKQRDTSLCKLTNSQVEEVCDLLADSFYDALLNNSPLV